MPKLKAAGFLVGAAGVAFIGQQWMTTHADSNTKEVEIPNAEQINEGEMKELRVGDGDNDKVLVARYQGKLHSVGNYCTHFGAPLTSGVLFDDKVLCPYHSAGFSIVTGATESGPVRDNLPRFEVFEKGGKSYVRVPWPLPKKAEPVMAKRDPNDKRRYVIVGGGPAGLHCAETLRQSNFTGEIVVVSDEDMVPYDRTLLTKVLPTGDPTKFKLREEAFFQQHSIDYKLGTRVSRVDPNTKEVRLEDGSTLHYDKLCVASGAKPRKPQIKGVDSKNVFFIRNNQDQGHVKEKCASAKSVVVLGGKFIGSESAAAIKGKYKDAVAVHLVDRGAVPFESVFGKEVGNMLKGMHEANGVKVHSKAEAKEILTDKEGNVRAVKMGNGEEIPADLVIVGLGVDPSTDFLRDSKLDIAKDGGLKVDPFLQTSNKDIFAAGDVACFPYWATGE